MKFKLLFLSFLAAFALSACDKKEAAPAADANKPAAEQKSDAKPAEVKPAEAAKPAETPAAPASDAKPVETPAAAAPTASDSGVPECEEFIKKYETCINDKVPAAQRDAMQQGFEQMRGAIAQQTDKAVMATACKQALEQIKPMLEPLGCKF